MYVYVSLNFFGGLRSLPQLPHGRTNRPWLIPTYPHQQPTFPNQPFAFYRSGVCHSSSIYSSPMIDDVLFLSLSLSLSRYKLLPFHEKLRDKKLVWTELFEPQCTDSTIDFWNGYGVRRSFFKSNLSRLKMRFNSYYYYMKIQQKLQFFKWWINDKF